MTERASRFPLSRLAAQHYRLSPSDLASKSRRELVLELAAADSAANEGSDLAATASAGELDATLALAELVAEELERLGGADDDTLDRLRQELGQDGLDAVLSAVEEEFSVDPAQGSDSKSRLRLLMLVFWLNHNPATASLRRLFDDRPLARRAPYRRVVELLFDEAARTAGLDEKSTDLANTGAQNATEKAAKKAAVSSAELHMAEPATEEDTPRAVTPPLSGDALGSRLRDHLEAPIRAAPRSLAGQLESAIMRWGEGVADERTLRALDLLAEERPRPQLGDWQPGIDDAAPESEPAQEFVTFDAPAGPGAGRPSGGPGRLIPAVRRRSQPRDREDAWKKSLVLQAKHTHVWLDQLSRRRGEEIRRLDAIPQDALARLVDEGVTGLWLIGVWERSAASRAIKHISASQRLESAPPSLAAETAEASAYSVHDYVVAADLGGDEAMDELVEKAGSCGLKIGVDVVPNHVGLDSAWVHQHPDWLLASDRCPFPGYDFDTPDLSSHPDVGLFLEKGYYDRTDAAVVFRRLDRRTGGERFVYHGNDGTGLPWNDTAQLDYTNAEVPQAMSDLIAAQARRFAILRFDAAMTLTRLHFQRLWFPAPGEGGAIPSRSEFGCSRERFEQQMPDEFWSVVTRRIEQESPDTLLIAEAFWLMEPFFVHELAMDRVYNSTFLHELRRGRPSVLRSWLERTQASDPDLQRHSVFYLTTPDEQSAAAMFGRGDRYFGAMSLLAVLPGTPLLGHGQTEGLSEKYGMEYLLSRAQEQVDEETAARHRREIVPLLARRGDYGDFCEFLRLRDPAEESGGGVLAVLRGRGSEAVIVVFNAGEHRAQGRLIPAPRFEALLQLLERDELGEADEQDRDRRIGEAEAADESEWFANKEQVCGLLAGWLTADSGLPSTTTSSTITPATTPATTARRLHYRDERSGVVLEETLSDLRAEGLRVELEAGETLVLTGFRVT